MGNGRGGVREGAGRKPKALLYGEQALALESRMVEAGAAIVDKMIEQALAGDVRSQKYIIDRILGRVAKLGTPPAEDRSMVDLVEEIDSLTRTAYNAQVDMSKTLSTKKKGSQAKSLFGQPGDDAVSRASTVTELARALKAERTFPGLGDCG